MRYICAFFVLQNFFETKEDSFFFLCVGKTQFLFCCFVFVKDGDSYSSQLVFSYVFREIYRMYAFVDTRALTHEIESLTVLFEFYLVLDTLAISISGTCLASNGCHCSLSGAPKAQQNFTYGEQQRLNTISKWSWLDWSSGIDWCLCSRVVVRLTGSSESLLRFGIIMHTRAMWLFSNVDTYFPYAASTHSSSFCHCQIYQAIVILLIANFGGTRKSDWKSHHYQPSQPE